VQVGDIDVLQRSLSVRRQVQRGRAGGVELRRPKYDSGRTVSLPDPLLAQLSRHVSLYCKGVGPDGWLFGMPDGAPPDQNVVGRQWRRACRGAAVRGVTLGALRHFYAVALISGGCDVATVQRALEHAKTATTLTTYARFWPATEDRTRQAADQSMREVLRPADRLRTVRGPADRLRTVRARIASDLQEQAPQHVAPQQMPTHPGGDRLLRPVGAMRGGAGGEAVRSSSPLRRRKGRRLSEM
jgi:integrase